MTTIKEYKAMMEGATDAPLNLLPCPFCGGKARLAKSIKDNGDEVYCTSCFCSTESNKRPEKSIYKWNNRKDKLTPELIRVIELAEDAMDRAVFNLEQISYEDNRGLILQLNEALSEIRKLKGE